MLNSSERVPAQIMPVPTPRAFGSAAVLVEGKSEIELAALADRAEKFADQCEIARQE